MFWLFMGGKGLARRAAIRARRAKIAFRKSSRIMLGIQEEILHNIAEKLPRNTPPKAVRGVYVSMVRVDRYSRRILRHMRKLEHHIKELDKKVQEINRQK